MPSGNRFSSYLVSSHGYFYDCGIESGHALLVFLTRPGRSCRTRSANAPPGLLYGDFSSAQLNQDIVQCTTKRNRTSIKLESHRLEEAKQLYRNQSQSG
jgi:hypothetical protein